MRTILLAAALAGVLAQPADAGIFGRRKAPVPPPESPPESPMCAIPTTSVEKTKGAMIILMSRRNSVVRIEK